MIYENVLQTIGNTPLIRLKSIAAEIPGTIIGKIESFNPGNSAKDRIALHMVNKAEKSGRLKPGGTLIEATSGNTGYSLAMIATMKGYRCILTLTSKASKEKISLLKSMGAEVLVCPANVAPEDPQSYYSRAEQLSREIPNSFYIAQNFNKDNAEAHYLTTGPEIWEATQGKITHYVCCAGTGGSLSGTARYLKEQNPNIKVIGVDAYGSVLKKYWETGIYDRSEIYSYKVEGLGKNIIPDNLDVNYIDDFIKVTDRHSAMRARQLAKMEGLLMGFSSGAAMHAVFKIKNQLKNKDVVVVLFPDHGSRYLGKIYNDEWMRQQGYLPNRQIPSYGYSQIKKLYRSYKIKYHRYLKQNFKH